jgi:hypothetical protein
LIGRRWELFLRLELEHDETKFEKLARRSWERREFVREDGVGEFHD